jgi:hypothetical protein
MEVADDGHTQALLLESFDDVGDGLGGIVIVDGDADDFAAGARQGGDLLYGAGNVRGVGVLLPTRTPPIMAVRVFLR